MDRHGRRCRGCGRRDGGHARAPDRSRTRDRAARKRGADRRRHPRGGRARRLAARHRPGGAACRDATAIARPMRRWRGCR
jgi:hypothetical protein